MYFICDVETTGFDFWGCDVISAGAVICDENYNKKSEFYETARPLSKKYWGENAEKIHGFSFDQASKFQSPKSFIDNLDKFISSWIKPHNLTFVCHANAKFDYKFLFSTYFKVGMHYSFYKAFHHERYISTMSMAKKIHSRVNLASLCSHYQIDLEHHNALSDTKACYELLKIFKGMV